MAADMEAMTYEENSKYVEPRVDNLEDSEHAQVRLGLHS